MSNVGNEPSVSNPRRRALYSAVAETCFELGFESADKAALETLTEMLQSLISEIGRSSRAFAELACRTEPLVGDVVMALVEMGINVESVIPFSKRAHRVSLPTPSQTVTPQTPRILQAGQKRNHPSHILDYYPSFPDPHAYIRTLTHKQPITEYYAIREKAASQKRDVERALTRFIAKTGDSQALFNDDTNLFPLIACKTMGLPYLSALLPKDQMFDEEGSSKATVIKLPKTDPHSALGETSKREESELEAIDNPYLRSIKPPKKKKR